MVVLLIGICILLVWSLREFINALKDDLKNE